MNKLPSLKFGYTPILTNKTSIITGESLLNSVIKNDGTLIKGGITSKLPFSTITFIPKITNIERTIDVSIVKDFPSFNIIQDKTKKIDSTKFMNMLKIYANTNFENFFKNLTTVDRSSKGNDGNEIIGASNKVVDEFLVLVYNEYISLSDVNKNFNYYYNNIDILYYIFTNNFGSKETNLSLLLPNVAYQGKYNETSYKDSDNITQEAKDIFDSYTLHNYDKQTGKDFLRFVEDYTEEDDFEPYDFLRINKKLSKVDIHIDFFSFLYNYTKGLYTSEQKLIKRYVSYSIGVSNKTVKNVLDESNNAFLKKMAKDNSNTINDIEEEFVKFSQFFKGFLEELSRRTINY